MMSDQAERFFLRHFDFTPLNASNRFGRYAGKILPAGAAQFAEMANTRTEITLLRPESAAMLAPEYRINGSENIHYGNGSAANMQECSIIRKLRSMITAAPDAMRMIARDDGTG